MALSKEQIARQWLEMAERDWKTVERLFASGEYNWSLFIGHLVVEKILKALFIVRQNKAAPRIHLLAHLADRAGLAPSERQMDLLDAITRYNINVRYPESQQEFYRLCTKSFAQEGLEGIKEIRAWLLEEIARLLKSPGDMPRS